MAKINNKSYTIKGSSGIEKLSLYTTLEEVNGKGKALNIPVVGKVYYAIGDINDPNATKKRLKINGKVYAGLREVISKKIYTKYYIFEPGKHDLYIPNNATKVTYYMYGGGSGMIVTQDPILMNPNTGDITVSAADADWFDRSLYFANQWEHTDENFEIFTNGQSSAIIDEEGTKVAISKGGKLFVYRGISQEKYKITYANSKSFDYTQYINTKLTPTLQANNEYTLDATSLPIAVYNTKIREEFPKRVKGASLSANILVEVRNAMSQGYRGIREKSPVGMENGYRIRVVSRNSPDEPSTFNEIIPAQYDVQNGNLPLIYNRYLNMIKLPTNLKKETTVYGKNISTKEYLANSIRKVIEKRTRCYIKYIPKYDDFPSDIRAYMERTDIAGKIYANSSYTNNLVDKLLDYNPPYDSYSDFRLLCRYFLEPDYRRDINTINTKDSKYKLFTQNIYNLAIHTEKFFNNIVNNMLPALNIEGANQGNASSELLTEGMIDIFGRSNLNMVDSERITTPHDTYTIPLDSIRTPNTDNLSKYYASDDENVLVVKSPFLRMNHTYYTNSVTELCNIDSNDTRNPDIFTNIYGTMNEPLCGCITGAKVQRATGDIDINRYKGKVLTFNIGKGGTLFFNTSNKFVGYWRVDDIVDRLCLDNNGMAIVKMELEQISTADPAANKNSIDIIVTPTDVDSSRVMQAAINTIGIALEMGV